MRATFVLWALVSGVLCSATVHAHHPAPVNGAGNVGPQTRLTLDVEFAAYELGEHRGAWQVLAPSLELAASSGFSLLVRTPVARIDDSSGEVIGAASWEFGTRVLLLDDRSSGLTLTTGVSFELPTGTRRAGLQTGHWEVSPFVAGALRALDFLTLTGMVVGRFGTGDGHAAPEPTPAPGGDSRQPSGGARVKHGAHGQGVPGAALLEPHGRYESVLRATCWLDLSVLYASIGVSSVFQWSESPLWGPLVARSELGLRAGDVLVSAGVDVPMTTARRYEWRGRVGVSWFP